MEYKDKIIDILNKGNANVSSIHDEFDLTTYVLHLLTWFNGFKCIATNEQGKKDTTSSEDSNETLPKEWNNSSDSYCLYYQSIKDPAITMVVKSLRMGTTLLVNAMLPIENNRILTLDVDTTQLIKETNFKLLANYKDAFKNLDELLALYESCILKQVIPKKRSPLQEGEEMTVERNRNINVQDVVEKPKMEQRDPLLVGGGFGNMGYGGGGGRFHSGDSDLNPSGLPFIPNTVGGGMGGVGGYRPQFPGDGNSIGRDHPGFGRIHFPYGSDDYYSGGLPGNERLPRGAVPPGARFDPFGPTQPRRGGGSNRSYGDEMPPPGFNDYYS